MRSVNNEVVRGSLGYDHFRAINFSYLSKIKELAKFFSFFKEFSWRSFSIGILLASLCLAIIVSSPYITYGYNALSVFLYKSRFVVNDVEVAGDTHFNNNTIVNILGVHKEGSLSDYDIQEARAKLMTFPWVKDASISKIYPSKIKVVIYERHPFAVWLHDYRSDVVDKEGVFIGQSPSASILDFARSHKLPIVIGGLSNTSSLSIVNEIRSIPSLKRNIVAFICISDDRWALLLNNGTKVLLPEENALDSLLKMEDSGLLRKLVYSRALLIDLRNPEVIAVKLANNTNKGLTSNGGNI